MCKTPLVHIAILIAFLINTFGPLPIVQAQGFILPAVGVKVPLSPAFNPPILKGIKVNLDNPFKFDFILDQGKSASPNSLKPEAIRLIKYFLASLTIPEKDLWVNLSPYEKNRIVPDAFGKTEMGRDLLAEDYMLKQITASLIYPEDEIGKKFWKRVYEEAQKKFGTTSIPVNTFNKVWIVPQKAVVYENVKAGTAYVVESRLKVMLEEDYLSLGKHTNDSPPPILPLQGGGINALGSQVVREIVIPELNKEVNEGKNFAQLRQVYNSLILAAWYKRKIKDSILAQVYTDRNKTAGIQYSNSVRDSSATPENDNNNLKNDTEFIYQRYIQAFKKGVYNYIKEEQDPLTNQAVPRKYFSGGFFGAEIDHAMTISGNAPEDFNASAPLDVAVNLSVSVPAGNEDIDAKINALKVIVRKTRANWLELFSLGRRKLNLVDGNKTTVALMAQALGIPRNKIDVVIDHFSFSKNDLGFEQLRGPKKRESNLKKVDIAIGDLKAEGKEISFKNVQQKSGLTQQAMTRLGRNELISRGVVFYDGKGVSERLTDQRINEIKSKLAQSPGMKSTELPLSYRDQLGQGVLTSIGVRTPQAMSEQRRVNLRKAILMLLKNDLNPPSYELLSKELASLRLEGVSVSALGKWSENNEESILGLGSLSLIDRWEIFRKWGLVLEEENFEEEGIALEEPSIGPVEEKRRSTKLFSEWRMLDQLKRTIASQWALPLDWAGAILERILYEKPDTAGRSAMLLQMIDRYELKAFNGQITPEIKREFEDLFRLGRNYYVSEFPLAVGNLTRRLTKGKGETVEVRKFAAVKIAELFSELVSDDQMKDDVFKQISALAKGKENTKPVQVMDTKMMGLAVDHYQAQIREAQSLNKYDPQREARMLQAYQGLMVKMTPLLEGKASNNLQFIYPYQGADFIPQTVRRTFGLDDNEEDSLRAISALNKAFPDNLSLMAEAKANQGVEGILDAKQKASYTNLLIGQANDGSRVLILKGFNHLWDEGKYDPAATKDLLSYIFKEILKKNDKLLILDKNDRDFQSIAQQEGFQTVFVRDEIFFSDRLYVNADGTQIIIPDAVIVMEKVKDAAMSAAVLDQFHAVKGLVTHGVMKLIAHGKRTMLKTYPHRNKWIDDYLEELIGDQKGRVPSKIFVEIGLGEDNSPTFFEWHNTLKALQARGAIDPQFLLVGIDNQESVLADAQQKISQSGIGQISLESKGDFSRLYDVVKKYKHVSMVRALNLLGHYPAWKRNFFRLIIEEVLDEGGIFVESNREHMVLIHQKIKGELKLVRIVVDRAFFKDDIVVKDFPISLFDTMRTIGDLINSDYLGYLKYIESVVSIQNTMVSGIVEKHLGADDYLVISVKTDRGTKLADEAMMVFKDEGKVVQRVQEWGQQINRNSTSLKTHLIIFPDEDWHDQWESLQSFRYKQLRDLGDLIYSEKDTYGPYTKMQINDFLNELYKDYGLNKTRSWIVLGNLESGESRASLNLRITKESIRALVDFFKNHKDLCACFKLGDPLVSGGNAPTDRGDDVTVYFFREPNDQEWKALAAIVEEYHRGDVRIGKTIIVDGKPVVGMKGSELGVINDDHVRQLDTKLSVIADKELVRLIHEDLYVRVDQKTGESNGYAMSEGGYYALKEALSWIGIKINYKVTEGFALVFDRELWTDEAMSVENLDHIQKILRDIGKDLFALEVSSLPLSDNQVSQLISDRGVLEGLKMQGAGHHQEFPWGETINQSITKLLNRIEALESKKSKIEDLVGQDQKGRDFAMNAQRPVGGAMMTKEGIKGMFDGYEMVGLDGKPYHMTYAGEFENEIKFLINGGEAGEIEFAVEDGYFVSIPWVASYGRKQGLFTKILEKLYSVMPVGPRIRGTHLANEATLRQMVEAILTVGEKQSGGSFDDLMRTQSGLKEIIPTSRVKADLKQDLRAIKDDREFNQFFVDLRKYIYQYWKLSQQDRTNKLPKVETLFLNTKPVASAFINAGFSNIELHLKLETDEKDVDFDFSFEKSDKALTAGSRTGGIDLTSANVNIQGNSLGIKFHLDPSQLQQLQNASGFVPVIISVRPVVDLRKFLGVT